jgi:hypothetical protein
MAGVPTPQFEQQLEAATVSLNEHLYAEGVGLAVDPQGYSKPAARLASLYARLLDDAADERTHRFALESWVDVRRVALDMEIDAAMDRALQVPGLACSEGTLNWRNWKAFECEADAAALTAGYDEMVERSESLRPLLSARLERLRADYAPHGESPVHIFAAGEGLSVEALRALLVECGRAGRSAFAAALDGLSQAVFGRAPGPAELRALYLNRMFEPAAPLFTGGAAAVQDALRAFQSIGFDLGRIAVDLENRPRKYPGAFCFPVRVPGDVRVSVRIASAHHLVDMLYHELGHAAHFSGIRADLPVLERYWIHSGTHETFSTLFERLLDEPLYLRERFGLPTRAEQQLVDFGRFKSLLTGAWLGASALTVLDTWIDGLAWEQVEARFAENMLAFTGIPVPGGFARLEAFTAGASIYPAGYVLASARAAHWLQHLRTIGGPQWWQSAEAQSDIRKRIALGGGVEFPAAWSRPGALLAGLGL